MQLKALLVLLPLALVTGCTANHTASPRYAPAGHLTRWSTADWQKVLDIACTHDGLIQYDPLVANVEGAKDALYRYVAQIGAVSPENRPDLFPTHGDAVAYYLNAYNALGLFGVLEKNLPANAALAGVYANDHFRVGGRTMNLNFLEKHHLRGAADPRVHFALNTMTRSSPPLRPEPYQALKLDAQLDDQARRFLSDPRGVQKLSDAKIGLSELFTRFYPAHFKDAYSDRTGQRNPTLIQSLRPLAAPDSPVQTATQYQTLPYDWSLNRA